jgi:hypothetical protein
VPVISVFFGIVIRMFYREHGVGHSTPSTKGSKRRSPSTASCWRAPSNPGPLIG